MSNHSPGKWRVEDGRLRAPSKIITAGDARIHIATVFPIGWVEERITEANAELMAAAPELLEVVREANLEAARQLLKRLDG